ncbi:hypothetical protein, partial [Enterococcus faecalis]|uniref:hypothetical protein n=1 Tax=Enterococcus faecalis TaxID=1351 RepID=UPI00403F5AAA
SSFGAACTAPAAPMPSASAATRFFFMIASPHCLLGADTAAHVQRMFPNMAGANTSHMLGAPALGERL